ncbi:protein kinase domain-containing protein [Nocardia brasiliensis]
MREDSRCARRSWQVSSVLTLIGSAALIIVLLHALAGPDRTLAGPVTVAYLVALLCALVMVGLGAVARNRRTAYHRLANAPAAVAMAGVAVAAIATVVPHAGDAVAAGTVAGTAGLVWTGWWLASLSMRGVRLLLTDVPMECTVCVLIGIVAGGWVGLSGYPASGAVSAGVLTTAALVHLFGNAAAALVEPPQRDETGPPTTPRESATRGAGAGEMSLTARDLIDISTPPLPRLPRRRPQARNMHELLVGITSAPKPGSVQEDSVVFGPEPARRPVPAYEIIDRINNERRQAAKAGGGQPFAARPRSLGRRTGARFGRYRLRSLVGKGGMGEVYEAFDTIQGRRVAVKLLSEAVALDPAYQANFRRQTALAAQLAAPYIVPIHDWGVINGVLFAATRLIDGTDLHTVLRRGPVTAEQAVSVIEQIAAALDAAHAVGLVHADVKPANILLTLGGAAYLSDFGIAHPAGDSGHGTSVEACAYRAPERFTTTAVTAGSDIYALTGVLFEALTGLPPFPAATTGEVIHRQLTDPPPRPSTLRPTIPPAMDAVIRQGMAKVAAERFPTATALARAARAALGATPRPQTPPPPQSALQPQPAAMPRSAPSRSAPSGVAGASLRSGPRVGSGVPPRSAPSVGPGAPLRFATSMVAGASPRCAPSEGAGALPRFAPSVVAGASPRSAPSAGPELPMRHVTRTQSALLPEITPATRVKRPPQPGVPTQLASRVRSVQQAGAGWPTQSGSPTGPALPLGITSPTKVMLSPQPGVRTQLASRVRSAPQAEIRWSTRFGSPTGPALPPEIALPMKVTLPPQLGVPAQLVPRVRSAPQAGTGWPTRFGSPTGSALPPEMTPAMKVMLPPQPAPSTWPVFAVPTFSAPPAPGTQRALPTRTASAPQPIPLPQPVPLPQRALPPQPAPSTKSARGTIFVLPSHPAPSMWACICDGA